MRKQGFTLLELLISITISSFVVLGMMQAFRNVQKMIKTNRSLLHVNKAVCLFFNQIERDFHTAVIPHLHKPEKETKKEREQREEKEKKETLFFTSDIDEEQDTVRIDDEKHFFFKKVSFINTNPFQIWGQKKVRLVRVTYELVKNKSRSTRDQTIYDLFRRETPTLVSRTLVSTKQGDYDEDVETTLVSTTLVSRDITSMYIKYQKPKKENDDEISHLFAWGRDKETKNILPKKVEIIVTFANERPKTFHCVIPIIAQHTGSKAQGSQPQKQKSKDTKSKGKKAKTPESQPKETKT